MLQALAWIDPAETSEERLAAEVRCRYQISDTPLYQVYHTPMHEYECTDTNAPMPMHNTRPLTLRRYTRGAA